MNLLYKFLYTNIGFVNHFLSWKGFLPLSRLTYCVYLIHYDYLTAYYAMSRKLIYYTFVTQLTTYFGIVVTVFGLAFIVSVTVEASFLNLEKLLFSLKSNIYYLSFDFFGFYDNWKRFIQGNLKKRQGRMFKQKEKKYQEKGQYHEWR